MRHEHSEVWGRSGFFGKLAATNSLLTIPKIVTRSPNTNLKLHHPITEDLHERGDCPWSDYPLVRNRKDGPDHILNPIDRVDWNSWIRALLRCEDSNLSTAARSTMLLSTVTDDADEQYNAPELPIGGFLKSMSLGGNWVILAVLLRKDKELTREPQCIHLCLNCLDDASLGCQSSISDRGW
jgi:hypothetical protein